MDWTIIIFAMISAVVYGLIFYVKAYITQVPRPPFDNWKFAATLIVAGLIGLVAAFSGATLNEAELLAQLAEYAGYVAIVETLLKALFGKVWPTSFPES